MISYFFDSHFIEFLAPSQATWNCAMPPCWVMIINIFFVKQWFLVPPPPHAEFDTRGNLFLCGLKKSGLRWFEPVESLVVKPSAVTKIKTALQSMWGFVRARLCVWGASRDHQNYRIFFFKADNATAVSVRIQITNKCWTLLNALYTLSWVEHTIFWTYDDSLFILL